MTNKRILEHDISVSLYRQWKFWLPALITFFIFLLVPNNILSKVPIFNALVYFVSEIIPSIKGWQKNSIAPEKTALLVSISWLFFPYLFLLNSIEYIKARNKPTHLNSKDSKIIKRNRENFYKRPPWERIVILISFYPLILLCLFIGINFSQPGDCNGYSWCFNQGLIFLWFGVNLITYTTAIVTSVIVPLTMQFKKLLNDRN